MDKLNVPKKYNRHVLKALAVLHAKKTSSGFEQIENILVQVEKQMRGSNNNDFQHNVQKSLSNLTNLGLLMCSGSSSYALRLHVNFNSAVELNQKRKRKADISNVKKPTVKKAKQKRKKLEKTGTLSQIMKSKKRKSLIKNKRLCTEIRSTIQLETMDVNITPENKGDEQETENRSVQVEPRWKFAAPWFIEPIAALINDF